MQELIEQILAEVFKFYPQDYYGISKLEKLKENLSLILPPFQISTSQFKDGEPDLDGEYLVRTAKGYQLVIYKKRHPFILCGDSTYCSFLQPILSHAKLPQ